MPVPTIPGNPGFALTPAHSAFGTVLTGLVPPYPGPQSGAPLPYNAAPQGSSSRPNWLSSYYTHLTCLRYTTAGTAHTVTVMVPLNFTYFPAGLPKNTTVIPDSVLTGIASDPGLYTTSYRYPLPGSATAPARPANAAISSTNKFVCYQLADGSWQLDTIASGTFGSTLTLTTGTPNTTYGAILPGGPLFYFGTTTLTVPATGNPHVFFTSVASTGRLLGGDDLIPDKVGAGVVTLNPGDPMLIHSNNATATGIIDLIAGDYRKY